MTHELLLILREIISVRAVNMIKALIVWGWKQGELMEIPKVTK